MDLVFNFYFMSFILLYVIKQSQVKCDTCSGSEYVEKILNYQELNGEYMYTPQTKCTDKVTYKQINTNTTKQLAHFYFLKEPNGAFNGWVIAYDVCSETESEILVRGAGNTDSPDLTNSSVWQEQGLDGVWRDNPDLQVHCFYNPVPDTSLSAGQVAGLVVCALGALALVTLVIGLVARSWRRPPPRTGRPPSRPRSHSCTSICSAASCPGRIHGQLGTSSSIAPPIGLGDVYPIVEPSIDMCDNKSSPPVILIGPHTLYDGDEEGICTDIPPPLYSQTFPR